jgi:hypothetical protein
MAEVDRFLWQVRCAGDRRLRRSDILVHLRPSMSEAEQQKSDRNVRGQIIAR